MTSTALETALFDAMQATRRARDIAVRDHRTAEAVKLGVAFLALQDLLAAEQRANVTTDPQTLGDFDR